MAPDPSSQIPREAEFTYHECPECHARSYPGEPGEVMLSYDLVYVVCESPLCPAKHPARMVPVTVVEKEGLLSEATVERAARALCDFEAGEGSWDRLGDSFANAAKERYLRPARAALSAAVSPVAEEEENP